MPWWAQLYLGILCGMAVISLLVEAHRGDSLPFLLGELAAMVGLVLPFLAFWYPDGMAGAGWVLIGLVVYSILWETMTFDRDLRLQGLTDLPRESPGVFLTVLLVGYGMLAPAWAMGILAGTRVL